MTEFVGFNREGAKRIIQSTRAVEGTGPPTKTPRDSGPLGDDDNFRVATIVSVGNDTLTVTFYGETDERTVAKPYLLRRTPFDTENRNGFTYSYATAQTRTSTKVSDASTEDQTVTPLYVADDEIICVGIPGIQLAGDSLTDIVWLDFNVDGREWAKDA